MELRRWSIGELLNRPHVMVLLPFALPCASAANSEKGQLRGLRRVVQRRALVLLFR